MHFLQNFYDSYNIWRNLQSDWNKLIFENSSIISVKNISIKPTRIKSSINFNSSPIISIPPTNSSILLPTNILLFRDLSNFDLDRKISIPKVHGTFKQISIAWRTNRTRCSHVTWSRMYLVTLGTHTAGEVSRCKRIKSGSRSFECAHGVYASRSGCLVHRATTVDELRNSAASDRQRCSTALWPAGVRSKHRYLGRAFPPRCAYSRVLGSVRGDGHSIHRFRLRFQVNRSLRGRGRRRAVEPRKIRGSGSLNVFVKLFFSWLIFL